MLVDIEVGNELSGGLRVGVKQRRGGKERVEPVLSEGGRGTLVSEVQLIVPEFLIFQYLMNLVPGSRRVPSGRFSSRNKAAIVGTKDVCETPGPLVSSVQSIVEKSPGLL